MPQVICEKFAGETISVHGHSVAFDADGTCLGVVTTDDFGKLHLSPLPDEEAEYLRQFPYVTIIEGDGSVAAAAPVEEMAVVADTKDVEEPDLASVALDDLTYKQLQALAGAHGINPVGRKREDLQAEVRAAREAE